MDVKSQGARDVRGVEYSRPLAESGNQPQGHIMNAFGVSAEKNDNIEDVLQENSEWYLVPVLAEECLIMKAG